MTIPAEQLLAALHWRYATKTFDPGRTIEPSTWQTLEKALVLTASSYGLQPWKFLVITDPALRAELRPTPGTRVRSRTARTWWCC